MRAYFIYNKETLDIYNKLLYPEPSMWEEVKKTYISDCSKYFGEDFDEKIIGYFWTEDEQVIEYVNKPKYIFLLEAVNGDAHLKISTRDNYEDEAAKKIDKYIIEKYREIFILNGARDLMIADSVSTLELEDQIIRLREGIDSLESSKENLEEQDIEITVDLSMMEEEQENNEEPEEGEE